MSSSEIVTAILTSAVISGLMSFILNYFFESRQQHRFEREVENLRHSYAVQLEKLKAEMTIGADVQHEITERRLKSYPHLVELVYRTRNMARELVNANFPPAFAEELQMWTRELEDCLYRSRIDLERDGVFEPIHAYKNLLKTFNLAIKDAVFQESRKEEGQTGQGTEQLQSIYASVETLHKSIIDQLSSSTTI